MASMAVPEMVATGANPESAAALAPVCSDRPCRADAASSVWVTKSLKAATEVAPITTAKVVLATLATCCIDAFMSLAWRSNRRAVRPRSSRNSEVSAESLTTKDPRSAMLFHLMREQGLEAGDIQARVALGR